MWPKCAYRGIEYTFDHLNPFTHVVDGIRVRVQFGAHVFCQERKVGDPADMAFEDGGTARTFCPIRYGLSQSLGQRLLTAMGGSVFESGPKFVFKDPLPHPQGTYVIAFTLRKSGSPKYDVKMQLLSAHARPSVARMRRELFTNVIQAVNAGQAVSWKKK